MTMFNIECRTVSLRLSSSVNRVHSGLLTFRCH